jgi:hypothetical protein
VGRTRISLHREYSMNLITALTATGLAAGLAFTGAASSQATSPGVTGAASSQAASPGVRLPAGGTLEHRVTRFCARVPDLLKRADQAQTRISGDATSKGSLAWLKARQADAESNDRDRMAARIERRIERRTDRLAALPERKQNLAAAKDECATLDLPAPSGS